MVDLPTHEVRFQPKSGVFSPFFVQAAWKARLYLIVQRNLQCLVEPADEAVGGVFDFCATRSKTSVERGKPFSYLSVPESHVFFPKLFPRSFKYSFCKSIIFDVNLHVEPI